MTILTKDKFFPHYYFKFVGAGMFLLQLIPFVWNDFERWDQASVTIAGGLVIFFFAKERSVDERSLILKLKALAYSFYLSWAVAGVLKLFWDFMITGYDFMVISMSIGIVLFYTLRLKE